MLHWHNWKWWSNKPHKHKPKLKKRLPKCHSVNSAWLQTKVRLKRKVCQLLLKVHVEWVWPLLPNWPKKQTCLCLSSQKKTVCQVPLWVKENQPKPKAELPLYLMAESLKVRKVLLATRKTCVPKWSPLQKVWLSPTLQRSRMKKLKSCQTSSVNMVRWLCKRSWKMSQVMS